MEIEGLEVPLTARGSGVPALSTSIKRPSAHRRQPPTRSWRARVGSRLPGISPPSTQAAGHAAPAHPSSRGRVRKAGFTVLMGRGLGNAVSLLAAPLISRVFEPAIYGQFALITGVVSVFVGVSTFRLEVQALRTADDAEATGLIWLGLLASGAWGAGLTLAAVVAVASWHLTGYWLSAGVLVFLASLQNLGPAALTRDRRYHSLAVQNFFQGASLGVVQLLLGLISASAGALLAGFGVARLGWLTALRRPRRGMPRSSALMRQNKRFMALAGSSAFFNALTGSAPILLVAVLYGDAAVGQLAIGLRVLVTPLSIIGQSAASANLGEVSCMLRVSDDNAVRVVRHGMRDLLAVGLIPCIAAGAVGVWAVPFLLGQKWREAGLLLAVLATGALAQFVVSPFSQLMNLTGDNRRLLMWDTGRFGVTVLSFCVPRAAGMSVVGAVGCWSVAMVVVYGALALLIPRAITRNQATRVRATAPKFPELWDLLSSFRRLITVWRHVDSGGVMDNGRHSRGSARRRLPRRRETPWPTRGGGGEGGGGRRKGRGGERGKGEGEKSEKQVSGQAAFPPSGDWRRQPGRRLRKSPKGRIQPAGSAPVPAR